jgi:hypothetical protein
MQLLCLCIQLERLPVEAPVLHYYIDSDGSDVYDDDDDNLLEELEQEHRKAPCFNALCALPTAQTITSSMVAGLLRLAVKHQHFERGYRLCKLPAAQQLPSQQLCELLLQQLLLPRNEEHRALQRRQLIEVMAGLQAAKELMPGAAFAAVAEPRSQERVGCT